MPPTTIAAPVPATCDLSAEHFQLVSTAHIEALAGVLFDWRADCEERLRVLTSVQRYVEKVRSPGISGGERALLLQEISRLLTTMASSDGWRRRAATLAVSLP